MHAHLQTIFVTQDLVNNKGLVNPIPTVVGSLFGTLILMAVFIGVGKTLFDSQKLDDIIRLTVAVLGIGGYVSRIGPIRKLSQSLQDAVRNAVNNYTAADTIYTLVFFGFAVWLALKYIKNPRWSTLLWLCLFLMPLFATSAGAQLVVWYDNYIGVNVVNLVSWLFAQPPTW
jgi:hypothetical protein